MSEAVINHIASQKPRPKSDLHIILCKQCGVEIGGSTAALLFIGTVVFHGRVEFTCKQCGRKHRWYPNLDKKVLEPLAVTEPGE